MSRSQFKGGFTAASAAILCSVASAQAAIIYDGFDAGGTFSTQNNLGAALASTMLTNALRAAVRFPVSCEDYHLTSISLPIGLNSAGGNLLRVRLTADAGGAPGATLEVLSQNQTSGLRSPTLLRT